MDEVSYALIQSLLDEQMSSMTAAEAHGVLVAMVCVLGEVEPDHWLKQVMDNEDAVSGVSVAGGAALASLFGATLGDLKEGEMSFQLFLPDDSIGMSERADAMASWCQGFLYSLGVIGAGESPLLSQDSTEVMEDMAVISRAIGQEGEEDEGAYMEISEYLRMGVLLINEDLRPLREAEADPEKLH